MNTRSIVGKRIGSQWYGGHVGAEPKAEVWSGWCRDARGREGPGSGATTHRIDRWCPHAMTRSAGRSYPQRAISRAWPARDDAAMQVLASSRARAGRPSRFGVASALGVGLALVVASATLLYVVFGQNFLDRFMPAGRASTYELIVGALAWTFALTAPAGFGLVVVARLVTAFDRWRARRPRVTPAVRLRRAIGDDHVVATSVRLPDGSRVLPEL